MQLLKDSQTHIIQIKVLIKQPLPKTNFLGNNVTLIKHKIAVGGKTRRKL